MPDDFKKRGTILFQSNNSRKMFDAFVHFGFPKHQTLPHGEIVQLSSEAEIYCYQVNQLDSCLGIRNGDQRVLNVNDAPIGAWDCKRMRKVFGTPQGVLNQFSIAGYGGFEDVKAYVPEMARHHLQVMRENHEDLGADVTIPFASFVFFSCEDNKYLNEFANKPKDVADHFSEHGAGVATLYPGDEMEVGVPWDLEPALARFQESYAALGEIECDPVEVVPLDKVEVAFYGLHKDLHRRYPSLLLRRLEPVEVEIPDLALRIRFSFATGQFEKLEGSGGDPDMIVNSQPLWFAFGNAFGIQTLGVSGRLILRKNFGNWRNHRILLAFYNAEIYLRPSQFFTWTNLRFLYRRRRGLIQRLASFTWRRGVSARSRRWLDAAPR